MTNELVEIKGYRIQPVAGQESFSSTYIYKVGDRVKLLKKEYSTSVVYDGVIIGFYLFNDMPSIEVCWIKNEYNKAELNFEIINDQVEGVEIVPSGHSIPIDSTKVVEALDREIGAKEDDIRALKDKKAFFLDRFERYLEPLTGQKEGL